MTDRNDFPVELVIISNGFVYVGRHDAENCTIYDPRNVRRWGTTNGIGQIAFGGPTSETALDACGDIIYNPQHLICTIATADGVFDEALKRDAVTYDENKCVVVAESGFVFIGICEDRPASLHISDASMVRSWSRETGALGGVSLGLGGVLDACGEVTLPSRAVIHRMRCVAS